ncbi:MAG: RNA polymerase sigma factor [Acidimicrobiia bacterium]|nr:MAG: RNA polymerase sigma factor [Acidimicrobiia bacterium]
MQENATGKRGNGVSTVEAAQSSDAAIYEALRDELVRFAAAIVGRDSAEDVLSTVMIRIMGRQPLAELRDARPYLYKAVLNEARSHLRSRHGRDALAHAAAAQSRPVLGNSPESLALDGDVRQAVLALPPRQRAATYLTYWNGCSIAETADLMGCSPGTVGRYLHLARRHLRRALDGR